MKRIAEPYCELCDSRMEEHYSTNSLSKYYVCENKECKYSGALGVYEQNVNFKDKKWFSEEEIRKAIEELFKYNKEKGTQLAFIGKNALYKKLFGDERAEIFKFLENYTNVEVN